VSASEPAPGATGLAPTADGEVEGNPLVVRFEPESPLLNSSVVTLTGTRVDSWGCAFTYPELELAPGETAIAARQIEIDFTDCTTKVEIGTPPEGATGPGDGDVEYEQERLGSSAEGLPGSPSAGITAVSSGYYRVWWEDVINIQVHATQSNIAWTWNGSCVSQASGQSVFEWLKLTGWSRYSYSGPTWTIGSCLWGARLSTSATYRNSSFCPTGTVWSYYDQVRVRGTGDGKLIGNVVGTWTTYPSLCPKLHYHTELRRTSG